MKKEERTEVVYLQDILDSFEQYTSSINKSEFLKDIEKQDAVIRRLEIIGESVKQLSEKTRSDYPEIPWRSIAGMRDVLIHSYFGVSIEMIWNVLENEISDLKKITQQMINHHEGKNKL